MSNTGWTTASDLNTWFGVTYTSINGVTALALESNQLIGSFPAKDMALLTNLATVSMWGNSLTGSIPVDFNNLDQVTSFDVHSNCLTGTLPNNANLPLLMILDLSDNSFTGTLPESGSLFLSLSKLDLSSNGFTSTIPAILGGGTSLTTLVLNSNSFTGILTMSHS